MLADQAQNTVRPSHAQKLADHFVIECGGFHRQQKNILFLLLSCCHEDLQLYSPCPGRAYKTAGNLLSFIPCSEPQGACQGRGYVWTRFLRTVIYPYYRSDRLRPG